MECITPFISIYVNLELGKGWISVGPAVNSNHGGFHQPWGFGFTQLWKIMDFASVCFISFFSSNDVEKTWTQTCPVSMKTAQNSPICHGLQWNWCFSMLVMVIYMDYMVYIYIYIAGWWYPLWKMMEFVSWDDFSIDWSHQPETIAFPMKDDQKKFTRMDDTTLWLCQQFAMENCHRNSGFTHWKWWICPSFFVCLPEGNY